MANPDAGPSPQEPEPQVIVDEDDVLPLPNDELFDKDGSVVSKYLICTPESEPWRAIVVGSTGQTGRFLVKKVFNHIYQF